MTLSVLIPTYNYNARELVHAMSALAKAEHIEAEIIVGDDASTAETAWMDEVEHEDGVRIFHAEHNLGRARIRNRLAEQATGKWLLFVDADAIVPDGFSLKKSINAGFGAPVVCGGLRHPDVNPNPEATLRYKYERAADRRRSAKYRNQHPHRQLSSFNLMVRRDVFMNLGFDERCTEYGYEDALFGIQLDNDGIPISHIDNPLIHNGLDSNEEFLHKTETAMLSLRRIADFMPQDVGIVGAVRRLERWHLTWAVRLYYRLFRHPMRNNLLGRSPNLFIFNLYKLGYFLTE